MALPTRFAGAALLLLGIALLFGRPSGGATSGLVAAYGFSEGSGATVADASGNANNGTVSGATWTTAGKYGTALTFNGSTSYVNVPDSPSLRLTTAMTLEAWVRPTALGTAYRTVLLKQQTSQLAYALYGNNHSTRPTTNVYIASDNEVPGTAALALNTWTFLAATYDGATERLFVNGAQVASKALSGSLVQGTGPLRIGGNGIWGEFFAGQIDEIRIYNRALATTELQSDMNAPVAPDTAAPSVPANLHQTGASGTSVSVAWTASTDNVAVAGYNVYRNGTKVAATSATSATISGLGCGATPTISVEAFDAAGNTSSQTAIATATAACDTSPPTTPSGLVQTAAGVTSVTIAWSASSDDTAVAGYDVLLDGVRQQTTAALSATIGGLACGVTRTAGVDAFDAAGNTSPAGTISIATASCDTTAPTVSITAPADGSSVAGTVSVTAAAADDGGVASVQLQVDGSPVGQPDTQAPYSFSWTTSSVANGSHRLSAAAVDNSGNRSISATVSVTVANALDTTNALKRVTLGPGFVDASAREAVRTQDDRVYAFVADDTAERAGTGPGVIHAYRADQVGIPTSFTEADPTHRPASTGTTHVLGSPDVRLDRSGVAHLVYIDESTHAVVYRTFSTVTDTWGAATTIGTGAAYTTSSIKREANVAVVLDGGDMPNVVYVTPSAVMYTALANGAWTFPQQVAAGSSPQHPQLATDGSGVLQLAWLDPSTGTAPGIRYAQRLTTGAWTTPEAVASSDVLTDDNSDQGPSIALDGAGVPYVLYVSAARTFTNGASYGAVQVRYRTATGWSNASPPVDALTHTPQIYMQGSDVYAFLGHDTAIHFSYLYRLAGQPWTALTELDTASTTDGSASVRWDPVRETDASVIDALFFDEDVNDDKTYRAVAYYMAVLPRGAQPAQTPDTVPPSVSINTPTASTTVSGTVAVSAAASDDRGVASVQFEVDGSPLGSPVVSPPYTIAWNTMGADGTHTLTAVALDAAGNAATSAGVTVTVDNTAAPAPPSFIRDLGGTMVTNTGNTVVLTVPSAGVAPGDTVVLWAIMSGTGGVSVSTIADSRGDSYSVDSSLTVSGVNSFVASGHAPSGLLPGDKITITFGGTYYSLRAAAAAEFAGIGPLVDARTSASGSGTSAVAAVSAPNAPELLITGVGINTAAAFTARPGFVALAPVSVTASGTTRTIDRAYEIVSSAGTYAGGGTLGASSAWAAATIAYR